MDRESTDSRVRLALELMRREYGQSLNVREMANRVGLSASRLEHLFKQDLGHSFSAELREVRLRQAAAFLRQGSFEVKEVAGLCGYSSVPTFSRIFTRRFGLTPSEFRRDRSR